MYMLDGVARTSVFDISCFGGEILLLMFGAQKRLLHLLAYDDSLKGARTSYDIHGTRY